MLKFRSNSKPGMSNRAKALKHFKSMKNPLNRQWKGKNLFGFEQTEKEQCPFEALPESIKSMIVYIPKENDFEPKPCPITGCEYLFPEEIVSGLMDTPLKDLVCMLLKEKAINVAAENFLSDIGRLDAFRKYARL